MFTYQDDCKHVQAQLSNIIVLFTCQEINNLTNEERNENITTHSKDKEAKSCNDGAALPVGIPSDLLKRIVLIFL